MLQRDNTVILLGILTLVIFGTTGIFLIEKVHEKDFISLLLLGWSIPLQLLTGVGWGLLSSGIALFIITRIFFIREKLYYRSLISKLDLNNSKIIFISFCAGVGEEIFFRAAIQPMFGIWLTSLIFVALHGYLNPFNWRISLYGIVMVFIIAGFGHLFEVAGIITVMTAHVIFDIVLLKFLQEKPFPPTLTKV